MPLNFGGRKRSSAFDAVWPSALMCADVLRCMAELCLAGAPVCYEVCRTCARQVCRCVTRCGGIVPGPSAIRTAQAVSDAWHSCSVGVCRSSDRCLLPAPEKITFSPGGVRRASQKADSALRSSQAVPHPSTDHLHNCIEKSSFLTTRLIQQEAAIKEVS